MEELENEPWQGRLRLNKWDSIMFEQSLLDNKNKRPWTVGVALLGEICLLGIVALIPFMYVQTLPAPELPAAFIMPRPPAPPPSPPPAAAAPRHQTVAKNQ